MTIHLSPPAQIALRITADAGDRPELRDVVTFLEDLNLLYELNVLGRLNPDAVRPGQPSGWILSRRGRRVPPELRMQVATVELGSPLDIGAVVTYGSVAIGAVWLLIQSFEKIYNLPADHRLKLAQARLAEAQAKTAERAPEENLPEGADASRPAVSPRAGTRRRSFDPTETVENRLRRARIRVVDVDVEVDDGKS